MSNAITRFFRDNTKNLVVAGAFLAAFAGAVGLGLATKQYTSAASMPRDCDSNAVLHCGATSPSEFITDVRSSNNNAQKDLQVIYADSRMGALSTGDYDRFKNSARMGKVYKNGTVIVDGQTVMTGANSLGREKFNSQRQAITIGGKTYYYSPTSASFASDSIDAMVMFDDKGVAETVILTSCGNPVWGTKVKPEYDCKTLNKKEVAKDTYEFTTSVHVKNASVNKVVYDFGDGTPAVTKTNPAEAVRHKYEKAGTFTTKVTVYFNLPGKQVVAVPAVKCLTQITVTPPPTPFYSCTAVVPAVLNNEKTKFRFTVKTNQGNGATLKDADFTLNGSSTVTGVTTKDAQGDIYKEYEFARDGKDYTVTVKVNFNVAGGVQSKTCEAKVTSGKTPVCVVNGKEYPVGSPECEPYKCPIPGKEDKPKEECNEVLPAELPKTGMGSALGLFAGTSLVGAIGHKLFTSRRRNG